MKLYTLNILLFSFLVVSVSNCEMTKEDAKQLCKESLFALAAFEKRVDESSEEFSERQNSFFVIYLACMVNADTYRDPLKGF
ncbi:hypothetical protein [Leptospira vanthielii]|uniref:Lipoprotein n=1 Tax=Leptospira vanthielii serovar Holland str. Waz Holland = ATCC 700522 TaxID=1218591 RepID=N1W9U2_9LEPT|nr:hypothetical protein [Leptospira vanthielii]EMY68651.1 hypothetical protein LEP1GSC199_1654 [Leptospira vanthielii serovar Holland str. Waz Holland = ATCC 700522]